MMPHIINNYQQSISLHLSPCPRCGQVHAALGFNELNNPGAFGWWATCPETNQPVLLSVVTDGRKETR